jgi:phosphoribosylamine--glycine ligase
MRFIVATRDYSGLGFAIRLQDEGHDVVLATNPADMDQAPERLAKYNRVGEGMVRKEPLSSLFDKRSQYRDAYWIWDHNHSVEENEAIRAEGFKVLGGGRYANTMEHDRSACLQYVRSYGLLSPPSQRFEDTKAAIQFCKQHSRTAYVYKPDEGANFETFVPESEDSIDANQEMRLYLSSIEPSSAFMLQERKEGIETNVEVWFDRGAPVFAFMSLESKRRCARDLGEMVGCAFDFVFVVPLTCRAVAESVGKLFPAYEKMRYTGFGDANFIASRDGVWFFEKCERFGYNAHPNLLFNLSRRAVAEVFASFIDGSFKPSFSGGFGAAVLMSTKANPTGGKPILFPERLWPDIYWWDVYRKGDLFLTAGYDREGYVLIVNGFGYTIQTAWEDVMRKASQICFPYRQYRPDGAGTDFPSSPLRRWQALGAMGYI